MKFQLILVRVWESLQNGDMPPPAEDMAKWEAEFSQLMQSQRDDLDYESTMRDAWENGLGSYGGMQESRPDDFSLKFDDEGIPLLDPYTFGTFRIILRTHIVCLSHNRNRQ